MAKAGNWNEQQVNTAKARIKATIEAQPDLDARLHMILQQVMGTSTKTSPEIRLDRYVWAIYALIHHQSYGGLSQRQIDHVSDLAELLILAQGTTAQNTRLPQLFSDLYSMRSSIFKKEGRHWIAAWELIKGGRLLDEKKPLQLSRFQLNASRGLLRLGSPSICLTFLDAAAATATDPMLRLQMVLTKVMAFRLSMKLEAAKELIQKHLTLDIAPAFRLEFEWHLACIEVQESQQLSSMLNLIKSGRPHGITEYVLEAILWGLVTKSKQWIPLLPPAHALARRKNMELNSKDPLFRCVMVIQQCYNGDNALKVRLQDLGRALEESQQIIGIDREILVWLAAIRWLERIKADTYADLAKLKYTSLVDLVSDGRKERLFPMDDSSMLA